MFVTNCIPEVTRIPDNKSNKIIYIYTYLIVLQKENHLSFVATFRYVLIKSDDIIVHENEALIKKFN